MPHNSLRPPSAPAPGMRLAAACAVVVLAVIFLGCMSIEIGGFGGRCMENGVLHQKGSIELQPGAEQDIYYPVAYGRPPNLELDACLDHYVLLEQKEDHFRVRNRDASGTTTLRWKARGMPAGAQPPVIVTGPPAPLTAPIAPVPAAAPPAEQPPAPTPLLATPDK